MGGTKTRTAQPRLLSGERRAATAAGSSPRRRSTGLVVLAALLVVASGLAVAAWGMASGSKETVLAVGKPVAKGQVITREDLVSRSVAGVDDAFTTTEVSAVVGKVAAVDLVERQILTRPMLTPQLVPGPGQAAVGLSLAPERVPADGLAPGDTVDVISTPAGDGQADAKSLDAPPVLASAALVYGVSGDATAGGTQLVTLVVDKGEAARIAAYSTAGRVAVIETTTTKAAG